MLGIAFARSRLRPVRPRSVAAWSAAALVAAASGCTLGSDEAGRSSARPQETTGGEASNRRNLAPAEAVERYRPRILRALAVDATCVAPACSTLPALRRRADALADAVRPLDDALATPALEAKLTRATTSGLRHSVRQLRTCIQLSAAKHAGAAMLEECRGPVADFHQAVADLRATFAERSA